jgi:NTP pyrophosphatase (non-canonical NTP hydrolase)
MDTKDLQKRCSDAVSMIDRKFEVKRDLHLAFTQLMEEVGELAREVNMQKLRNRESDPENLKGEFADVVMQLSALAEMLGIDLEEAVESKIAVLRKRHGL